MNFDDAAVKIKDRLSDLRDDLRNLSLLNNAQSRGIAIDQFKDARESLFRGDESAEFELEPDMALGKNVRAAGSPVSPSPFHGRYISQGNGSSRSLKVMCREPDVSEWFGLELDSDGVTSKKFSRIYIFMKLLSEYPIDVWVSIFLIHEENNIRIDLKNMRFDKHTHHSMLVGDLGSKYEMLSNKTNVRVGFYLPTSRVYDVDIIDIRCRCTPAELST